MADAVDFANEQVLKDLDARVAARQAPGVIAGIGQCLYCAAKVRKPQRWCDADCRDDWERAQRKPGIEVAE